ncbi:DUF302 domain-containing protein [Pseudaestuariivita atlantica]|uniref:DUF302 domain-containing protein n=1 Tax=Pseudaestuariivita atlantica TaxID=1317121 RepID=A0A0L1JRW2_9RHOB|nr:DUF302 domain-containing protein [Pseudaestuariivita atlantica]KNG94534.1 hypothetical protein ATO11_03710 [Pseudaestuariivita atlantica]
MRCAPILAAALVANGPALSDPLKVPTDKSVAEAADDLVAAITEAGATTLVRVDQVAEVMRVGEMRGEGQLIIFGSPKPAGQDRGIAGMALPLKVVVYEDAEGEVWLAYEDPAKRIVAATGAEIDPAITSQMAEALERLTNTAAA